VVINVIVLVAIDRYFINGYWWLFHYKPLMVILFVAIDGYSIVVINCDFINGYWWLMYYKLLLLIICYIMTIGDYSIINYY
jgi:hypothetical protein